MRVRPRPSLSVDGDHVGGEGEEVVARLADHSRVPGPLDGWLSVGQFGKFSALFTKLETKSLSLFD